MEPKCPFDGNAMKSYSSGENKYADLTPGWGYYCNNCGFEHSPNEDVVKAIRTFVVATERDYGSLPTEEQIEKKIREYGEKLKQEISLRREKLEHRLKLIEEGKKRRCLNCLLNEDREGKKE